MAQPNEPTEPTDDAPTAAGEPGEEPTERLPVRWTGAAAVRADGKKRRGVLREPTQELPTVDDEPWPSPPPPRPANAPVTAPYPPPPIGPPPHGRPPRAQPRHGPPPHAWPPPQPYPPKYVRRRRRWPWVLGSFLALVLCCCGGCFAWAKPFLDEYPAMATMPENVAGLVRLDDAASKRTVEELKIKIRTQNWLAENVFAGIYAEPETQRRPVTVFGETGFLLDPKGDLTSGFDGLTAELSLTDVQIVDPGRPGGHMRCANGRKDGKAIAVCGWADHGSMAVALFVGRTIEQSAPILKDLREAIIERG